MANFLSITKAKRNLLDDFEEFQESLEQTAKKTEEYRQFIKDNNLTFKYKNWPELDIDAFTAKLINPKTGKFSSSVDLTSCCVQIPGLQNSVKQASKRLRELDLENADASIQDKEHEKFSEASAYLHRCKNTLFEYQFKLEYIQNQYPKKKAAYEKKIAKYNEQIANIEEAIRAELPDVFQDLIETYTDIFYKNYKSVKDKLAVIRAQFLTDSEFIEYASEKRIRGTDLYMYKSSDEQLKQDAEYSAKALVLTLWYSVIAYTGSVTSYRDISLGNDGSLNGYVTGEKGTARVQTIQAGGYNIQRLHYRVLVHKTA